MIKVFHDRGLCDIKTSSLISSASQWTGTSIMKELRHFKQIFPFFLPLKILTSQKFSDVFRGYGSGTLLAWNGLVKMGKLLDIAPFFWNEVSVLFQTVRNNDHLNNVI